MAAAGRGGDRTRQRDLLLVVVLVVHVVARLPGVVKAADVVVVSAGNVPAASHLLTAIHHHPLRALAAAPRHAAPGPPPLVPSRLRGRLCRPNSPQRPNSATFTFVVAAGGLDGDDGDRASVAWWRLARRRRAGPA
uniref:Uncharacterized protein n=1 Tax=Oryza glumipatula TaxID=40148 RepID=A0A0D9ZBG2_9ORYZ